MKEDDNYWVDENNNKWNKSIYSKEIAKENSSSLTNCSYCYDCSDCSNCSGCSDCSNCSYCYDCSNCSHCSYCSHCSDCSNCSHCSYCSNCSGCSDCSNCSHCSYCSHCSNCSYCSNCSHCSYCSDCSNCYYCYDCSNFKENPERIMSSKIGSRKTQTIIYFDKTKNFVICGCFKGSLEEFEARINKVYPKDNIYNIEYTTFINKVKKYMED
jgi:hypothetical protein